MESSPPPTVKDVKILETVEDIQERREQVLKKYVEFKEAARSKREMLEDSRRFQYFRRDADELEHWIEEKLQVASDESFKVIFCQKIHKYLHLICFLLFEGSHQFTS